MQSIAIPTIFLLISTASIENILNIRVLTPFRNIVAAEIKTPPAIFIKDLITRHAAMNNSTSSSWTKNLQKDAPHV